MAEKNNYLDGLDMLLNQSQAQPTGALPSAEQDIQQTYDNVMDSPSAIESS